MNVAIIPARGGSKRIPKKNVKMFFGKPMIVWSIEAALSSGCFDRVIVSTDDPQIATILKKNGAEAPFVRPPELSCDHTPTAPVSAHAVNWIESEGAVVDKVCCIYPTAPFVRAEDIRTGLELITQGLWKYVFTAATYSYPIFRSFKLSKSGGIKMFFPECFSTRSQDLPEAWHDAGQFYWGLAASWKDGLRIFDAYSTVISLPRWLVQDIDTPEDWERAEMMAKVLLKG